MTRKVIAVLLGLMAFGVNFFDETYKLKEVEWVPEVLGAILITAALFVWNPEFIARRQSKSKPPTEDDNAVEETRK